MPKFKHQRKATKPRYTVGEVIGNWEILDYLGYYSRNDCYVKNAHHYKVKCKNCGEEYDRDQSAINTKYAYCVACRPYVPGNKGKGTADKPIDDVVLLARRVWRA